MTSETDQVKSLSSESNRQQMNELSNTSGTRKNAERYLFKLANESDNELRFGSALSWFRLQNAYRILDMPHSKDAADFAGTWRTHGRLYPFYEQYLIHTGQIHNFVFNKALVEEFDLDTTNPQDPKILRLQQCIERK
ncbi:MAG: hypothetical protein Q9169_008274 [Polycauliona sp. 2 TL-2023]